MTHRLILALCLILPAAGCKIVNAPLPALAADQIDATTNSILQPAHAFAAAISAAVQSTDPQVHINLSPAQMSLLVKLNKTLNIADPLEQAYHAQQTSAPAAQLQTATSQVSTAFSAAQSAIPVPGK